MHLGGGRGGIPPGSGSSLIYILYYYDDFERLADTKQIPSGDQAETRVVGSVTRVLVIKIESLMLNSQNWNDHGLL